jgi:hypothetical protein
MANASDYLRTDIGAKFLNRQTGAALPITLYAAAIVGNMTSDGTGGAEVSTGGGTLYARVEILANDFTETPASSGIFINQTAIDFPVAGTAWGSVESIGVYDVATAGTGNLIFFDDLTGGAVSVTTGITLTIPAGSLVVTIA